MKKAIVIFLSIWVSISTVLSQPKSNLAQGDDYFRRKMYPEAIESYKKALSEDIVKNKFYMTQQVAKTYKNLFDYRNAAEWYEKLMAFKDENQADNFKEYADILCCLERYEEALKYYKEYCGKINRTDLISFYEKKCAWPSFNTNLMAKYDLVRTNLQSGNKGLGIMYYNEGLLFALPQKSEAENKNKTVYYDIAYSKRTDSAGFAAPEKIQGSVNKDFYECAPSITADGKYLFYTSNASTKTSYKPNSKKDNPFGKDGLNVLKIFRAENLNGKWENIVELSINSMEFSCAYPFISKDGSTLYFASNRPGGKGGYDLYKCSVNAAGKCSEPENLGDAVNTYEDEFYPFISGEYFYFSSRGLPGYGGADIFKAKLNDGKPTDPKNLGKPFNSSKDDFTFITIPNMKEGFFTSNRDGDNTIDQVYFFKKQIEMDTLRGIVLDAITGKPVEAAKVDLYMIHDNGDSTLVKTKYTAGDGKWEFIIHPEKRYKVHVTTPGYVAQVFNVPSMEDNPKARDEVRKKVNPIRLKPEVKKGNIVKIDNIYFDFDKATLKPESIPILENLYTFLAENPGAKVELSAHTDGIGSDAYNNNLSQKRAQSCYDWLVKKGIARDKIVAKGYGKTKLLNNCRKQKDCPEEQHAINRRVEVKFL